MGNSLIGIRIIVKKMKVSKSSIYSKIHKGLFSVPLHFGGLSRWPEYENELILAAVIAGWSEDDVRLLVKILQEERENIFLLTATDFVEDSVA